MKLLIFGGTFDPPHIGHMAMLKAAMDTVKPDKVLVIPAGVPPHKSGEFSPPQARLAMCESFTALGAEVEVADLETGREGASYTWDTVQLIQKVYMDAVLYLCVGSDMLLSFETWRCWRSLLQAVTLVVLPRRTEDEAACREMAERLRGFGGRVLFAKGQIVPMASTELRRRVAAGEDIGGLVPEAAHSIIRREGLYAPKG